MEKEELINKAKEWYTESGYLTMQKEEEFALLDQIVASLEKSRTTLVTDAVKQGIDVKATDPFKLSDDDFEAFVTENFPSNKEFLMNSRKPFNSL